MLHDEVSGEQALDAFYAALLDDDPAALYDRAPCGYLSTTPDGTIVKVNETFLTLTGYRKADLVGRRSFVDLLTGGGRLYHETHYAPMLRMQGKVRELALDIVRADGERLPALVNSVLERDHHGAPRVIRTAVFDATERRGYEHELLEARRRAEASEERATVLARTLQASLIPPQPPVVPGLEVSAAYRPAGRGDEIGGDFYDVFQVDAGSWVIVVGDVRGKGVDAAVVTGLARHTIRAAAIRSSHPAEVLDDLNQVLLRYGTDRFCTIGVVRLRRAGGHWTATVSTGGHPLPLLSRGGSEPVELGRPGVLVGVFPGASFAQHDIALLPGDAVILYTDGVSEARGERGWYGEEGVRGALQAAAAGDADLAGSVLDDALRFQAGSPRDDIVVVGVRVPG